MPDGPPGCRQLRQHLGAGQWLRRPAPQGAARREGRRDGDVHMALNAHDMALSKAPCVRGSRGA